MKFALTEINLQEAAQLKFKTSIIKLIITLWNFEVIFQPQINSRKKIHCMFASFSMLPYFSDMVKVMD